MADVKIVAEPFSAPESRELDQERQEEIDGRYGHDAEPGVKPTEADLEVFLVARDGHGRALGCGALRALGGGAVELKRMYVRPRARRTGLGRRIVEALEAEARGRGFEVCRLETGVEQHEALALYQGAGYREIECFGAYASSPISRCFERRIGPRRPRS